MSEELTAEEAVRLVKANAWRDEDGREVIHTRLGGFGADWPVNAVVGLLAAPGAEIGWGDSLLGHDLYVVQENGKPLFLDVRRPEVSR